MTNLSEFSTIKAAKEVEQINTQLSDIAVHEQSLTEYLSDLLVKEFQITKDMAHKYCDTIQTGISNQHRANKAFLDCADPDAEIRGFLNDFVSAEGMTDRARYTVLSALRNCIMRQKVQTVEQSFFKDGTDIGVVKDLMDAESQTEAEMETISSEDVEALKEDVISALEGAGIPLLSRSPKEWSELAESIDVQSLSTAMQADRDSQEFIYAFVLFREIHRGNIPLGDGVEIGDPETMCRCAEAVACEVAGSADQAQILADAIKNDEDPDTTFEKIVRVGLSVALCVGTVILGGAIFACGVSASVMAGVITIEAIATSLGSGFVAATLGLAGGVCAASIVWAPAMILAEICVITLPDLGLEAINWLCDKVIFPAKHSVVQYVQKFVEEKPVLSQKWLALKEKAVLVKEKACTFLGKCKGFLQRTFGESSARQTEETAQTTMA